MPELSTYLHCAPEGAVLRDPSPDPRRTSSYLREPSPNRAILIRLAVRDGSRALLRSGSWHAAHEAVTSRLPYDWEAQTLAMDAVQRPADNAKCYRCGDTFYSPKGLDMCSACIYDRYA